jgi:hypothetical protein
LSSYLETRYAEPHIGARRPPAMPVPVMKGHASLNELPDETVGDKISRKILVCAQEMIVFRTLKAGAPAAPHEPPTSRCSGTRPTLRRTPS